MHSDRQQKIKKSKTLKRKLGSAFKIKDDEIRHYLEQKLKNVHLLARNIWRPNILEVKRCTCRKLDDWRSNYSLLVTTNI